MSTLNVSSSLSFAIKSPPQSETRAFLDFDGKFTNHGNDIAQTKLLKLPVPLPPCKYWLICNPGNEPNNRLTIKKNTIAPCLPHNARQPCGVNHPFFYSMQTDLIPLDGVPLFYKIQSVSMDTGASIFMNRNRFDYTYPFRKKIDYPDTLMSLFHDIGVPNTLVVDGASEMLHFQRRLITNEYGISLSCLTQMPFTVSPTLTIFRKYHQIYSRKMCQSSWPNQMTSLKMPTHLTATHWINTFWLSSSRLVVMA